MLVKDPQTGQIVIDKTPTKIRYLDTGKVKIGSAYIPKTSRMTRDEEIIQSAMLGFRVPSRFSVFMHWLYVVVVVVAICAVAIAAK